MITIIDIAKRANVSSATVSYVLNNKQINRISEKTQERIRKIAEELNYSPNAAAKNLNKGKTETIGFLYDESYSFLVHDPFCRDIFCGIYESTAKNDYRLMFSSRSYDNRYPEYLRHRLVDGIIYLSAKDSSIVNRIKRAGIPFVLVTPDIETKDSVCIESDDEEGIKKAIEYLTGNGYKNVYFATGISKNNANLKGFKKREENFKKYSIKYKIRWKVISELLPEDKYASYIAGKKIGKKIKKKKPDAVIAANDWIALGIRERIKKKKIEIIGYDGLIFDGEKEPVISTLKLPLYEIGRSAVEVMLNLINEKSVDRKIKVKPELFIKK